MRPKALAGALMLLAALPAQAGPEPVALVTHVSYGTHLPGLGTPALDLAKLVKERSAGTLTLDLIEPGEKAKPHEILDKVSAGKIDAGFANAGLWAAKLPAAALFGGFPFGPDAEGYLGWFDRGNGRKLYQELYDHAGLDVVVLPCAFGGGEAGGWFAKNIGGKDDIKGLRMRIFGLGARVMAKLGATTLVVPGKDLARAFDKKEIDAAELYPLAVDRGLGLKDKVKLIYEPGWHQPETVLELIVNQERWKALGERRQKLLEDACRETLRASLVSSVRLQSETMAELSTEEDVRVATWPDGLLEAFRAAWAEVAKEEGERDYFFKEVLEDIEKFRARSAAAEAKATPKTKARPAATAPSSGRR